MDTSSCIRAFVGLLVLSSILVAGDGLVDFSPEAMSVSEEDPWGYGYSADSWKIIGSSQRLVKFDEKLILFDAKPGITPSY